jgi:hypothetical protein
MTRNRTCPRLMSLSMLWTLAGYSTIALAEKASGAAPVGQPAGPTAPAGVAGVRGPTAPTLAKPTAPTATALPVAPSSASVPAGAGTRGFPVATTTMTTSSSAASGPGVASSPAPPSGGGPARPAPELEQMKVLEGSWHCDGRAPSTATGPEHAYRSSWKFKRDLDNFWWAAEYQQVKAKTNPTPLKARGFMTYDPLSRSFNLMGMDNAGGTTRESTAGWNGDVVILAGDASLAGKRVPFREVITRKGDREFTWRGEMKVAGDWMTLGEDRCHK